MAYCVDFFNPFSPSIQMYPYDIRQANALPHGAAEMAEMALSPPVLMIGLVGRNGTNCFATQIGPTPGPPPPCGMAKVLCRFK